MKNNEERVMSIMKKVKDYKKQKGEVLTATALGLCAVFGLFVYTNMKLEDKWLSFNTSGDKNIEIENNTEYVALNEIKLPTFNSKQEILDKLKLDEKNQYLQSNYEIMEDASDALKEGNVFNGINAPTSDKSESVATGANRNEFLDNVTDSHSTTNVQVQGVDEGDIVKTNGDFIYYLNNQKLYIFNTQTLETKLVKTIELGEEFRIYARELYIDENYITVIGEENANRIELFNANNSNESIEKEEISEIENEKTNLMPEDKLIEIDYSYKNSTMLTAMYMYDINSYELVKTVKTEGNYVSSRKIDNNIYMVTNRYLYSYSINEDNILPIYTETNVNGAICKEIDAQDIKYFPEMEENNCNYMLITSINLSNINNNATIDTYLGAGSEIFCSKENLYVTRVERPNVYYRGFISGIAVATDSMITSKNEEPKVVTKIHKFKLLDGAVKYIATGEVSGELLNQYSMDESNGYFRITTTSNAGNSLYVLDEKLETVGKLENLAKGERIYATRFMGDKCYIVTYKTVDPLYVIDLSDPTNPNVLGELKLPGYSTYLHPLGKNHLIGFGEDSIEKSYIDWEGKTQVTAYNVGLKLAIFDVSDLNNPKEIHSVRIGGRGSSSTLIDNPRTLYYDAEAGIFAFPAMLCEETKFYQNGTPMYGDVIFSGALVYNLDIEDGIELRGKIEHEKTKKYYNNSIERIISIGENFYTISPEMIKVTNIDTMKEIKEGTCKFVNLK